MLQETLLMKESVMHSSYERAHVQIPGNNSCVFYVHQSSK